MTDETIIGAESASSEPVKAEQEVNEALANAEEDSTAQQTEGEVKKKKPSGFQRKMERMRRENAAIAEEKERLSQELAKYKAPATLDSEPQLENFKDWNEYNKAVIQHGVDKALKQRDQDLQKRKDSEERQKAATTWRQKVETLMDSDEKYEDFDDVIGQFKDKYVHPSINQALGESDLGAQMAYYLGENPEIVDSLNQKTPFAIAKELAKIEASFSKPPARKVSNSSPPITPVKGSAKSTVNLDKMDTLSYLANRHPGLLKRR